MNPRTSTRRLALVLLVLLSACNDDATAPPLATAVTITPGPQTFTALGITQQFTAVARDANGTSLSGKPIFWISLTPGVASVSSTGLVTALANGEAEILAVVDGVAGSVDVTVSQFVDRIVLQPATVSLLGVGAVSAPFDAAAYDSNDSLIADLTFSWSVADSGLAALDPISRIATARSVGTTTVSVAAGNITETATVTVLAHFYVDAVNGDDANNGTTAATAFEHISHALSVASAGNTIKVLPGEYSVLNGETFPLVGAAGVKLIGDEANKGGGAAPTVVIRRAADSWIGAVFQPPPGAIVAGFTITFDIRSDFVGVSVREDNVMVRNNRITGGFENGISARPPSAGQILGNVVTVGGIGIYVCGVPGLRIERNTVTGQFIGMLKDNGCGSADLGGGAAGSAGGNVFSCNTSADVVVLTQNAIVMASGNQWDHVPPTVSSSGASADIRGLNGATVTTTGATLAPSACP